MVPGTVTASTALYWAFLYLVLYPDVQEKIYQEIKKHIGKITPIIQWISMILVIVL